MADYEKAPFMKGHVVYEEKIGNTICRICDDYVVKTKEERDAILERVAEILSRAEERRMCEAALKQSETS